MADKVKQPIEKFYAYAEVRFSEISDLKIIISVEKRNVESVMTAIQKSEELSKFGFESVLDFEWIDEIDEFSLIKQENAFILEDLEEPIELFYARAEVKNTSIHNFSIIVAVYDKNINCVMDAINNSEELTKCGFKSVLDVCWVDNLDSYPLIS
jgi:nitrogen regulatory protein PII